MCSSTKRTLPSDIAMVTPPGCSLLKLAMCPGQNGVVMRTVFE